MGNNASVPISYPTNLENPPCHNRPGVKKSSLPGLAPDSHPALAPPVWRRASEPTISPRRKSILRKNNRRRSDEEREANSKLKQPEMPTLVIEGAEVGDRNSQDSYEGLMIRVGERKFSRAQPVDTGDALEALERITRAASFSSPPTEKEKTGLGFTIVDGVKPNRSPVPFSFDVNYRLDSPRATNTFQPSPSLRPFRHLQQSDDISPHDSPVARYPLSPISHWSDSSACGLTPPQTFQSFRNSVNLPKTINRYSNLFNSSSGDSATPSPQGSSLDLPMEGRSPARSRLGGMWKGNRGKKGKGKAKGLGEIVVVKAERVGSSRYSELRAAAGRASEARSSSASSSLPTSPDNNATSSSRSSSRLDRASWIHLDPVPASAPSPNSRRHSSPDPQLVALVAASPELTFAGPNDNIFVPVDSDNPPGAANPAPAKISTRLPSGHPAAFHLRRFQQQQRQSPPTAIRRPRLSEVDRSSSYTSAHRSSAYTTNSRHSVVSEAESTSSALQATVQQGFRTSRVGSVAIPLSDVVQAEPVPLPSSAPNDPSRRPSVASAVDWTQNRRPSQASALSFPRSESPGCPRTVAGRQLSITSTFFGDSPSSQESSPPPLPLPPHELDFRGYSLTSDNSARPSRPPSLDLDLYGARSSTPNSLPALTSATSATFSTRSSMDPCPSLQVPIRPYGRLSLEQPDLSISSFAKPLAPALPHQPIDFSNFSLSPWTRGKSASPPPHSRHLSPTAPADAEWPFHHRQETKEISQLKEYSWNRASAGDARLNSSALEDRRETYPRSSPPRATKQNVFDTLIQQAMYRNGYPKEERKRGLSREEVSIWLGDH
ncbi:hypothetical protein JCM3765_006041 [Sporobolomyces pararoseus]